MVTVSNAVAAPVRKLSGLAAGLKEASRTFQARRRIDAMERAAAPSAPMASAPPPPAGQGIRTTGQEVPARPAAAAPAPEAK